MYHVSCFIPSSKQATPDGHISKHHMGISQEILSMNTLHKVPTSIVFKISRQLYPGILHLFHIQELTLNLPEWSDEYHITTPTSTNPNHPYLALPKAVETLRPKSHVIHPLSPIALEFNLIFRVYCVKGYLHLSSHKDSSVF